MRPRREQNGSPAAGQGRCYTAATSRVKEEHGMNAPRILAIVLIAAGVLGLLYHSFSYTKSSQAAKVGSLELTVQHKETVDVPNWLGVGAIVAGAALLVFGGRKS